MEAVNKKKRNILRMAYQRVLLKLSGEALMGDLGYGIDPKVVAEIADQVAEVIKSGIQLVIVVGGGNIFRGVKASAAGMDRATADYIGMIATVMNALTLQDCLERIGIPTRVQTAIAMQEVAEPYIRRRAIRHFKCYRPFVGKFHRIAQQIKEHLTQPFLICQDNSREVWAWLIKEVNLLLLRGHFYEVGDACQKRWQCHLRWIKLKSPSFNFCNV